jgi:hypothetical protein
MSKQIFFIILVFSLLLLTSCKEGTEETNTDGTFKGGTEGISAKFVNLNPPTEFKKSSQVPLKIKLENHGEAQVALGNAKVKIASPSPSLLGISNSYKSTTGVLLPVDTFTDTGGEQEIDFGKISYSSEVINEERINLIARYCYDYNTHTNIDVCLQSRTAAEAQEAKICEPSGEKVKSGTVSSGPIQVISVQEDPRPDQIWFAITVKNEGMGNVYNPSASCESLESDDARLNEKNKVLLEVTSPTEILCDFKDGDARSSGIITLDEGSQEIIRCWRDVEETTEDKLKISLTYKYREQITKAVKILEG